MRTPETKLSFRAAFLASGLLLAASGGAQAPAPDPWIGHAIGLEKPAMTYLGTVPVVDPGDGAPSLLADFPRAALPPVEERLARRSGGRLQTKERENTIALIALNAETGETYRLSAPREDFDRLHREMERLGETSPGESMPVREAAAEGSMAIGAKSWSVGHETLVSLGITEGYATDHYEFKRIGQIDTRCTGTLVGNRHVLTAAHCVVDREQGYGYSGTFRPRSDRTDFSNNPLPSYGTRNFVWYYFPARYWDGSCVSDDDCNQYDIALGILSSNMSAGHMGYGYAPFTTMQTWTKKMRGYPHCFSLPTPAVLIPDPDMPSSCQRFTLHGDFYECEIRFYDSTDADGWKRELFVSCDGATGMGGSAMYTLDSPLGMIALGVYSESLCVAEACAPPFEFWSAPNIITRITPEYAGMISMGKALWDCPSGSCL